MLQMTFVTDILEWKSRHIKKGRNKAKKKKVTSCSIGTRSSNADLLIQNLEFILTIVIRENHITFVDPKII